MVTGIGTDGRSMIVSDADAPGGDPMAGLWRTDPAPGPEGYDGEVDLTRLEPPAGGTSWRVFDLPPDAVVAEYLARQEIWRNRTGRPVRMAVVMVSTRDGEAAS